MKNILIGITSSIAAYKICELIRMFKKANYKTVLISIAIGLIVFILNIAVSTFLSYILSLLGYHASTSSGTAVAPTWGSFFLSLLTVAILPAICEEFTHRGLLLSGYKKLGFKKAVILSALMFGLIHLNVNQFFYATVIGLVLAVVTLYSRSIVPAIIIHFMNNGINVYLEFAEAKGKLVLDLYCGAGTIGLSMAKSARKIIGAEIVPDAVENAEKNAAANGIENAEFICADAAKAAQILFNRNEKPNVIVIDPPRKGCGIDAAENIAHFGAERIVMVSCNPATAARDCMYFSQLGYTTEKCVAVDMFPRTGHVECVVLMSKGHN